VTVEAVARPRERSVVEPPATSGPPRPLERLRRALVVPLFVLGSLLGAALVSALIFAADQALPATLLP
jgi:hypothetical protein